MDTDIANYADGNTIYKEHENICDLFVSLQEAYKELVSLQEAPIFTR